MPVYSAQVTNLESIGPIIDLAVTPHPAAAKAMEAQPTGLPKSILVSALIDTGASHSVIQQSVADGLGLQPIGKVSINTPSCHNHPCNQYVVLLILPSATSGLQVPVRLQMTAIGAPLVGQNIQCLLGRDFLKHVLLVYNGPQDSFYVAL